MMGDLEFFRALFFVSKNAVTCRWSKRVKHSIGNSLEKLKFKPGLCGEARVERV